MNALEVQHASTDDEAQIRKQIDSWVKAFRAKDIDGVMALYAPALVSFDLGPPLEYVGAEAYREPWEETFSVYEGPIGYEVHDLSVTTGDGVAFSHSLNRMSGTTKDGRQTHFWLRWTACYRKIDGQWLITHENVSVPVDLESGRALLDYEPSWSETRLFEGHGEAVGGYQALADRREANTPIERDV